MFLFRAAPARSGALPCQLIVGLLIVAAPAAPARAQHQVVLDRVAVRFVAPELSAPRFVLERELAFEARLEALASSGRDTRLGRVSDAAAYAEQHVRAALERHIAETLLASLKIEPEPTEKELARQMAVARAMLENAVGGARRLAAAERAEGLGAAELDRLLRRRARASLYLHRMVAPMLAPSAADLRRALSESPFAGNALEDVEPALRRWYVARALRDAVSAFYQNARARLEVTVVGRGQ